MTQTEASNLELINHRRLPRRDWILLPLIAFLTICLITFSAALIARWLFAESKTRLANCMILDDPSTGPRGIPNCSVKEKLPETGLVQFGLNSAGYRAGMDLACFIHERIVSSFLRGHEIAEHGEDGVICCSRGLRRA